MTPAKHHSATSSFDIRSSGIAHTAALISEQYSEHPTRKRYAIASPDFGLAKVTLKQLKDRSKQSYVSAFNFAEIYIGLDDTEQALASLEKAYADRSQLLTVLTFLDSLRANPRFKDLVRRMGLRP